MNKKTPAKKAAASDAKSQPAHARKQSKSIGKSQSKPIAKSQSKPIAKSQSKPIAKSQSKLAAASPEKRVDKINLTARKSFGIYELRPGQRELIEAALAGRDAVGIMPTGSGKSLCFQIPGVVMKKTVLVVSPLISLMQDQHEKLLDLGISAAKLNSTLSSGEEQEVKESLEDGSEDIVYVTPERLENEEYLELLRTAQVGLVVVDEAHCISQWGHDFRPAYTALSSAIKQLGRPPIMALTATATEDVTQDIVNQLGMNAPLMVRHGVDRPNLLFSVFNTVNDAQKKEKMLELINETTGTGIVYVATVKAADEVAQMLRAENIDAQAYHGKLPIKARTQVQDDFMHDQFKVIVATKAFGMGIDKPDVRFVIHYQFPDSVESYYQEAGRAGRDGQEAKAVLLYQLEDKRIQSYFLGGKYPNREEVTAFFHALQEASKTKTTVNLKTLAEIGDLPLNKLKVIANYLEGAELIKKSRGIKAIREFNSEEELSKFLEGYESRHQTDRDKLSDMMHYAQTMQCRVIFIQKYFGEEEETNCGRCDNCNSTSSDLAA